MRFLGVDYGLKRIGLALSEGSLAEPLGRIIASSPSEAFEKILAVILEHKIEVVVFGLPNPDSIGARVMGEKIAQNTAVQVFFIDETMTSADAAQMIKNVPPKKRKDILDTASATLILNSYLEENPQTNI